MHAEARPATFECYILLLLELRSQFCINSQNNDGQHLLWADRLPELVRQLQAFGYNDCSTLTWVAVPVAIRGAFGCPVTAVKFPLECACTVLKIPRWPSEPPSILKSMNCSSPLDIARTLACARPSGSETIPTCGPMVFRKCLELRNVYLLSLQAVACLYPKNERGMLP